jgi:MFS family permease
MATKTAAPTAVATVLKASWAPLAIIVLAQLQMGININALPVSLGPIVEDLNAPATSISTALVLYSLFVAAFVMLGAKIGKLFGERLVFQVSAVGHGAAMALMAISTDASMMNIAQALAGIAAALLVPTLVVLIAANYRGRQQEQSLGILASIPAVASGLTFVVAGLYRHGPELALLVWTHLYHLTRRPASQFSHEDCAASEGYQHRFCRRGAFGAVDCADPLWLQQPQLLGNRDRNAGGAILDPGVVARAIHVAARRGVRPGVFCLVGAPRGAQEDAAAGAGSAGHTGGAQRSLRLSRGGRAWLGDQFSDPALHPDRAGSHTTLHVDRHRALCHHGGGAAILSVRLYDRLTPRFLALISFVLVGAGMILLAFTVGSDWSTPVVIFGLILVGLGEGTTLTLLFNVLVSASPKELAGDVGALRGVVNNVSSALGAAFAGVVAVGLLSLLITTAFTQSNLPPALEQEINFDLIDFVSNDQASRKC